jgi:hypothetical protein
MGTAQIIPIEAGSGQMDDRWSRPRYLLIFLVGIFLLIGVDLADGVLFNGDTDDLLRAVEVRAFLSSGNWYDMSFPSVRMPDVFITPWSRLVDVPYAAIAFVLQPLVGQALALTIAFKLWPPVMAAIYGLLTISILRRIAPSKAELPLVVLLGILVLSIYAIWEFSPGRIDHHNVQMLLLLAMLYGICRWDRPGGIISGAAVAVGVVIGLETLPVLAVTLLALASAWLLGFTGSRRMLQWSGLSVAVTSLVMCALVIRPAEYWTPRNDTFSAPFAEALVGFGLLTALTFVFRRQEFSIARVVVFILLGIAILGGIVWQYPSLLDGPFPMIHGLAKTYWFDRIYQEKSALQFFAMDDYRSVMLLVVAVLLALGSAPAAWRAFRDDRPVLPILWTVVLAALLLTALSNRFLRLALAITPLLLPVVLGALTRAAASSRLVTIMGAGLAMLALVVGGLAAAVPKFAVPDAFDYLGMNDCRGEDFSAIDGLTSGRISTPPALGLQILYHRPQGISVSSISFHRSAPAIAENLQLYMAGTPAGRSFLLKGFDYLAVCRVPPALAHDSRLPLYSDLMAGNSIPGLVAITGNSDALMLFRIDHAAMR